MAAGEDVSCGRLPASASGGSSVAWPIVRPGPGLVHLQTFMAVYRHRTLSEAATTLGVSQPAVSQRLQALEALTGPLFERHARGVHPLPRAHRLAHDVGDAIGALEAVLERER